MIRYEIKLVPWVIDKMCNIRKWYLTIDLLIVAISIIAYIYVFWHVFFNAQWATIMFVALLIELLLCAECSFARKLHLLFTNRQCKECIREIESFHEDRRYKYSGYRNYDRVLFILQDVAIIRRKFFRRRWWELEYVYYDNDPFIDPILSIFYEEEEIQKWRTAHPKKMKAEWKVDAERKIAWAEITPRTATTKER